MLVLPVQGSLETVLSNAFQLVESVLELLVLVLVVLDLDS